MLSIALAVGVASAATALASPEAAITRLRADVHGVLHSTLTADGRAILALGAMRMPLPASGTRPAAAVRDWLGEHAEAFGLDPARDECLGSEEQGLPGGWLRVTLAQRHEGLPVVGADARAVVDPQGRLRCVQAGFVRGPWPAATALVGGEAAQAVVVSHLPDLEPSSIRSDLAWCDTGDGPRLVWVVHGDRDGRPCDSWVSASDATVVALDVGVVHAAGRFYPVDPGGALEDVTLLDLLPGPGLSSAAYRVDDVRVRPVVPLALDDFRYPPTDSMFDQVNAFALTQSFVRGELQGRLGWSGPRQPFVVRVNYPTSPYAALTAGRFVQLSGAIPGFVREVPRAADLVFHELTHAMIYDHGILSTGPNREAGALHEGLADYFAAVATNDVRIGEWVYPSFPQGATRVDRPLPQWSYAHYDAVGYAGGEAGSAWGNGMILSGALWDLRLAIGSAADSLALEALDYLPSQPTWVMFGNALLQADGDRHGERFASTIFRVLSARGWRGGVVAAAFTGPAVLAPGQTGVFIAAPCCNGLYRSHYLWSKRVWCRGFPCGEWLPLGEGDTLRAAFDEDTDLALRVVSAWGDTVASAPRFVNVVLPSLRMLGPTRVVQGADAVWRAAVSAVGPYQVYWTRQDLLFGAPELPLGTGLEVRARLERDAMLRATLRDAMGREAQRSITVTVPLDEAPPLFSDAFELTLNLAPGTSQAEVRVELPTDARLRLRVFDVRGGLRRVVRDAYTVHGAHVFRGDVSDLGSGVYFLEARAGGVRRVARFIVLR